MYDPDAEQGIKLLQIPRNAVRVYRTQESAQKAELLRFIMPGSFLQQNTVVPVFNPPFDIIHQLVEEARETKKGSREIPDCLSHQALPVGLALWSATSCGLPAGRLRA